MKRLLVALLLSLVLTLTLVTPAFADGGNGNMGGKNAGTDPDDSSSWLRNPQGYPIGLINGLLHVGWGPWITSMMSGGANTVPNAYGWHAVSHSIRHIFNGQPPAKPHWAGGP